MSAAFDDELIGEFLTEANELIEQLDGDLVTLETEPETPGLLDQIFRALHTIKGAASFLNLSELIEFAHAAEDALNALRKGEAAVDDRVTDALLRSVDILRGQLDAMGAGEPMTPGPPELIDVLHKIAEGSAAAPSDAAAETETAATPTGDVDQAGPFGGQVRVLSLPPEKADLVEFMADDVADVLNKLDAALELVSDETRLAEAGELLEELGEPTRATADFFDFSSLAKLADVFATAGKALTSLPSSASVEIVLRLRAARLLVDAIAGELAEGRSIEWSLEKFTLRVDLACGGDQADAEDATSHDGTPEGVLASDEIAVVSADAAPDAPGDHDEDVTLGETVEASASPAEAESSSPQPGADAASTDDTAGSTATAAVPPAPTPPAQKPAESEGGASKSGGMVEQTVRVEVGRLESLLNLVGEMVLTKNQVLGHARQLREASLAQELREQINTVASDLDRLTGELQMGVMRTRMQPLSKLFGRYPRIIRDLARKTGKKVELIIEGGDTEVDKSVLEQLGDPLVHMLRNSVDHGVESPQDRLDAEKPEVGTIQLTAEHQGGHVRVTIRDNGRGIDREKIAGKAVERGLTTPELVAQMSDSEVFKFIFAAGFSTAVEVSDLSGRGVGMDVVRTNIAKLGGQVNVISTLGEGTTMEILIPLTVAIMPAMLVGVGRASYAIPIMSIHEIVRNESTETESVGGTAVIRLREEVLPLIDLRPLLSGFPESGGPAEDSDDSDASFAVVVGVGEQKAGLVVDRLGGQQEVVIKPLEDEFVSGGCFSGATILEDGSVSFILDVIKIVRGHDSNHVEAAASATA
ncbi:MAG: chemotaxis protein CheA [Planctomycetota bacterium]